MVTAAAMFSYPHPSQVENEARFIREKGMHEEGDTFKISELHVRDEEGLIPVNEEYTLLFVVDCPSLDLVEGDSLMVSCLRGPQSVCRQLFGISKSSH